MTAQNTRMLSSFDSLVSVYRWLDSNGVTHPATDIEVMWLKMAETKDAPGSNFTDYQLNVTRANDGRRLLKATRARRPKESAGLSALVAYITTEQRKQLEQLAAAYGLDWKGFCEALADGKFYPIEPRW